MGLVGVLQENNVVRAADWEGIKHIVYTIGLRPKADSHFLAVQQCLRTEEAIVNSKISIKANEFAPVEDCLEVLLKRKPLALKEYLTNF